MGRRPRHPARRGGGVERPVEVPPAWEDGAGVAAARGDDDVGSLDHLGGEDLRGGVADVDAYLGHRRDGGGVHLTGSRATRL